MNDYGKISARGNPGAKSRSIDFSDLSFSPPQTPKYPKSAAYKTHQQDPAAAADSSAHEPVPEEEGGGGERFGVILSRNCSSASQRFRAREKGGAHASAATLQAAVRRAFSMRKSSSVAEGYRRIHDTAEDDGDGDCDGNVMSSRQPEARVPRKKRGRIITACKRIFGF